MEDLDPRLRAIYARMLRIQPAEIRDDSRRGQLTGWDSLAHIELVSEMETEFSVTIEPEHALEIETFGDAKRIILGLVTNA